MDNSLSNPRNRKIAFLLLALSCVLAITAVLVGIDDNLSGALLAFLAAVALVVAFVHPWRTARKFIFLLLASIFGFILFTIMNIVLDTIAHKPGATAAFLEVLDSQAMNAFSIIFAMVCSAAVLIGAVGSVAMAIRKRRQTR